MSASNERENRYAEAIIAADPETSPRRPEAWAWEARAVMAVADEEQAELRAALVHRIEELDPSDGYHNGHDYDDRSYYAAIDRCVRLINGSLTDWTTPMSPDEIRRTWDEGAQ